jgi:tetratricopeptide (TPR) repeat protein
MSLFSIFALRATVLWSRLLSAILAAILLIASPVTAHAQRERTFELSERVGGELSKIQPLLDAKNYDGAIRFVTPLLAGAAPNSYDQAVLNDILAKIHLQKGDYASAITPMETALRLSDSFGFFEGRALEMMLDFLSKLYYSQGIESKAPAQQQQYLAKATQYVKRLIDLSPTPSADNLLFYTTLLYNRAVLNPDKIDHQLLTQARQEAEKALLMSVRPRENFYLILLSTLQQQSNYKEASEYYELLVRQYPSNRSYWQQLAAMYSALAQESKDEKEILSYNLRAILTMERAQALGLLNTPRDNFNLIGMYFNIGQFGRATELLYAGLKNGGVESTQKNWELLAYSYQQINRENQAVEVLLEAAKLYPESGQLEFQVAQIYYALERSNEAYRHFKLALDKGNLDRPLAVYSFLAYLCYELGKLEEALAVINDALKIPTAEEDRQMMRLKQAIEDALAEREAAKVANKQS